LYEQNLDYITMPQLGFCIGNVIKGCEGDLEAHQHQDAEPPPFNIERDGDPRISWIMYYDFVVTKTEAFYNLQPGYVATANYPSRVKSEKVMM
jgi:hypothetical protein